MKPICALQRGLCGKLIPQAASLFSQAILQSGHCSWGTIHGLPTTQQEGLDASRSVLDELSLPNNLTALRDTDVSVLKSLETFVMPSVDGNLLQQPTHDMVQSGEFSLNAERLLFGSNSMDSLRSFPYFGSTKPAPRDDDEFDAFMRAYVDDEAQLAALKERYYPISDFAPFRYKHKGRTHEFSAQAMRWTVMNADVTFKCAATWFAQRLIDEGAISANDVFAYNFIGPQPPNYVTHAADIPFVFNANAPQTLSFYGLRFDEALARRMNDEWAEFAVHGAPSEEWHAFGEHGSAFVFGDDGERANFNVADYAEDGYRNGVCSFWIEELGFDAMAAFCAETPWLRDNLYL